MAGETPIGGIVGFLRLDNDQFMRAIAEAIAATERLDGKDVNVDVKADTTGANAKLAVTERQVDKLDKTNAKVDKSSRQASRGMGVLATAIIAVGPAIVPLAAGATGLAAAFGGMGAAGVLAIVGIRDEMKRGTTVGLTYKAGLDSGKAALMDLAKVASGNVLGPFQAVVRDLNSRLPGLRGQIGDLSTVTGKAVGALGIGLMGAFQSLEPLMRDASVYVLDLSTRFQGAMSGPGIVAFGDYVRSVFPQVMTTIESIVTVAGHLVAAFAPLGLGTLGMLRLLSDLITSWPVDTLATIATLAGGVYLGFRTWQGLSGLVSGFGGALERMGIQAGVAATAVRGLNIAAGVIGAALAVFSLIVSHNAEKQREAEDATNRYADALRRSNGVIDDSVRASTAKSLADAGVLDAARKLGLSLPDVTSAALGNADAMARVNAVIAANPDVWNKTVAAGKSAIVTHGQLNDAADKVRVAIAGENDGLTTGAQKNKDIAAATATAAAATSAQATAVQTLASQYGTSAATYQAAVTHQQGIATQAQAATIQMQLENNAAGLLKQSLDALNGKAVDAATAQNQFESSLANMGDHVTATGKKITFTTTSIKDMSSASVSLRGQLLGQIAGAKSTAEAYGEMTGSSEKGRAKLVELRDQIIKNAVAHGVDKDAVTKYVDEFLKIPKSVPPTKLQVDTKNAIAGIDAVKAAIATVTRSVGITVRTTYVQTNNPPPLTGALKAQSKWAVNAPRQADGGFYPHGVRAMADGAVSRSAMIMRTTSPILWNEAPGGESYIPLAPSKRARSTQILEETNRALGSPLGGGRSGLVELGPATIAALAATMSRVQLQARLSPGSFDEAMAVAL